MAKVLLNGADILSKALKRKQTSITADLQRIVRKHGAGLQQKAMRIVPVDTSTLKRSILLDISYNGLTATVGATASYGGYVEYGTRFMEAQPYIFPSYNVQLSLFKKDIDKLVK